VFLGNKEIKDNQLGRIIADDFEKEGTPFDKILDDILISWCDKDPVDRYPLIVSAIQPFSESAETNELTLKPIIYTIFEKAPDLGIVLEELADAMRPMSWIGSFADHLNKWSVLLQILQQHDNAEISAWAKKQFEVLQEEIKKESEWEKSHRAHKIQEGFE